MTNLEKLRASNAWDHTLDLPTIPMHKNPWIYLAYCCRLCIPATANYDASLLPSTEKISAFLESRETAPGWIGDVSHDEVYGAAFMSRAFARRLLARLFETDGHYEKEIEAVDPNNLKTWFFRFWFIEPAIRTFAEKPISLANDLQFAADLVMNAFKASPAHTSGILLRWLAAVEMSEHTFSRLAVKFWAWRLTKKGLTPKRIFAKHYLTEVPVMAEIAEDHFG